MRKLFGFCWDAPKLTAARQALGALNGVSITSSAPWNIEITAHEARKARMVERAAQLYGIAPDHIVVFGDGSNDVTLLTAAGIGVAMDNATPLVKRRAAAVTDANMQDGVARYLETHVLA